MRRIPAVHVIDPLDINNIPVWTDRSFGGCVYILQFGKFIKIGRTFSFERRLKTHYGIAHNYAFCDIPRCALTSRIYNEKEIEYVMLRHFEDRRVSRGELFDIKFQEAVDYLKSLKTQFEADSQDNAPLGYRVANYE